MNHSPHPFSPARVAAWLTLAILLVVGTSPVRAAPSATGPATRPTMWLVGDSTVKVTTAGQQGWGDPLVDLFDASKIRVENRARGGRSSRSYQTEGLWAGVLKEVRPGDFVMIQMGHNDPGSMDDARGRGSIRGTGDETKEVTKPDGSKEVVRTYGWYLRRYVADAKAKGATPILLSYIPRCPRPGGPVTVPADLTSYALWARQVAEAERVPFIDLHTLVWERYAGLTPEEIKKRYFCEADFTHTNAAGASLNAEAVADGVRGLTDLPLRNHLATPAGGR